MIDYSKFFEKVSETPLSRNLDILVQKVNSALLGSKDGNLPRWLDSYDRLPLIKPSTVNLNSEYIAIGTGADCIKEEKDSLEALLMQLHPWRKGPYDIFGIKVESEWRSDMKWARLKGHLSPLEGRVVLDIGCGNGYHCLRSAGEGARLVMGVDFTLLYAMQFQAIQKYIDIPYVSVLPVGLDDLPDDFSEFDTVFSMGVIYHRKDPCQHLKQLRSFLREDGELVLESLIIDGDKGEVLIPADRYAKMRNVYFIPSILTLEGWLKKKGFHNIKLVDVKQTTGEEQRVTEWMGFQSLDDFLDPKNKDLTIEGYPAPKRAIFLANKT